MEKIPGRSFIYGCIAYKVFKRESPGNTSQKMKFSIKDLFSKW